MTDHKPLDGTLDAFDPMHLFPALVAIVALMLASVVCICAPLLNDIALLVIFGLPMVLLFPGYVLINALFPARKDLDLKERITLSIAIVPPIGIVLNYTPWSIHLSFIVASLVLFTAAMVIITRYRRSRVHADERFTSSLRDIARDTWSKLFSPGQSRLDRVLSVILIILIVAAIAATIYVIVFPREGEHFTEFYILGEDGKAEGYAEQFAAGDPQTVIIGISNHEYRTVTYTVETILLTMTTDPGTNASIIHAAQPLDSFTTTLAHNETQEFPYTFSITDTHYNRLQFLLYNETMPPDGVNTSDRIEASYQDLHLWIKVVPPGEITP